jgi:hypothetical protein
VDEAVALAANQQGDSIGELQADEASGVMRAKAIAVGKQIYQGTLNDPNGFPGLIDFINTQATIIDPITNAAIDQTVNAGGAGAGTEIVWAIWNHIQGVHFLFGCNQGIDIKPWTRQQVQDANAKKYFAWVSNLSGFLGLSAANFRAVGMIKNIKCGRDGSGATPLTDKLIAQLEAKFPVGLQPNMYLMSRGARASLQQSRSVTLFAQLGMSKDEGNNRGIIAPLPTATASGVPIIATDSIQQQAAF